MRLLLLLPLAVIGIFCGGCATAPPPPGGDSYTPELGPGISPAGGIDPQSQGGMSSAGAPF